MGKRYEIFISDEGVKAIHHHATDGSEYKEFFPPSVGEQILTLIHSEAVQGVKIEDWTKALPAEEAKSKPFSFIPDPLPITGRGVILPRHEQVRFPSGGISPLLEHPVIPGEMTAAEQHEASVISGNVIVDDGDHRLDPPPSTAIEPPTAGAWVGSDTHRHRPLQGPLANNFPGKEELEAADYNTYAKVRALVASGPRWWKSVPGIGDKGAVAIAEAVAAAPEMVATDEETERLDKVNHAHKVAPKKDANK